MNDQGKILLGFIAGAAVGAIAGILLAPEKGQVIRQGIADKSGALKDNLNAQLKNGVNKFNSLSESAFSLINKYGEENPAPVNHNENPGQNYNPNQNF